MKRVFKESSRNIQEHWRIFTGVLQQYRKSIREVHTKYEWRSIGIHEKY